MLIEATQYPTTAATGLSLRLDREAMAPPEPSPKFRRGIAWWIGVADASSGSAATNPTAGKFVLNQCEARPNKYQSAFKGAKRFGNRQAGGFVT